MQDMASLLRAYNAALHEARTQREVHLISAAFQLARPGWSAPSNIRHAHDLRVTAKGSPSDCDAALSAALCEIGGTNG